MANYENILYEKKRRGVQITLNRPKVLNALNSETMAELVNALEDLDRDQNIRAIILTGNQTAFAAGADLKVLRYFLRGFGSLEIARALGLLTQFRGVTDRTIRRDIAYAKARRVSGSKPLALQQTGGLSDSSKNRTSQVSKNT